MPIWADVFGSEKSKSLMMTLLLISSPLGIILGYGGTAALQESIGWKWAFYIQAMLLLPTMLTLICTPSKYFILNSEDVNL